MCSGASTTSRFFFWRWRFASSRPIGLHGRLPASEPAVIRDQGQPDSASTIVDISLGGAKNCGSPAGVGESRRSRRFIAARRRFATTFPVSSAGPKDQVLAMGSVLFSRREFRCAVRLRPDSSPVPITARSTTSTCLKCCSPSARDGCDRSNSNRQARCSRQRAIAGRIRRQVPAGTARQRPNAIRCPDRSLPPPDQIPRVFVGHSFDKMSPPARKDRSDREPCKRLYFIPHKSVLSRPSDRIEADIVVYCQ
jgi:hypothetical protein